MDYRAQIKKIRGSYLRGEISFEQAKGYTEPLLKEMNKKGEKIAKKFGRKFNKLTFGYIFR